MNETFEKMSTKMNKKLLLGLCPIGKFVFSNEDAIRIKNDIKTKLNQLRIDFVDIDGILPDGLVKDQSHVEAVCDYFKKADIDCLFIPHCNFGTEGAAGMIAKKLAVPTLLWGHRDDKPLTDGTRLRDSLCGMFATSKVLHKLNVPFTYIENCRLDEPQFDKGLDVFVRAAIAANVFRRGIRIGQIGQRIDFFWTTIVNESELLERFNVEILPIDMVEFIRNIRDMVDKNRDSYKTQVSKIRSCFKIEDITDQSLSFICAMRDHILELAKKYELDGFAIQDFMSLVDEAGAYCLFANSMVGDNIAISCESDIHGAISSILLQKVSLTNQPVFLTDVTIRHPDDDNGVLLWHAGAPLSMKHPQSQVRLGHHWILPSPLSGMPHFRLKDGDVTVVRFDGDHGRYKLAIGQGSSIDGAYNQNNYLWVKVKNWSNWERNLICGPFIHHVCMIYGLYQDALLEACKYIHGLDPVILDEIKA